MMLRSHPIDQGKRWVVEGIVQRPQGGRRAVLDRTVVVARCLHLHVSEDRADACRARLGVLAPELREELMLGPAGRQTAAKIEKRRARGTGNLASA